MSRIRVVAKSLACVAVFAAGTAFAQGSPKRSDPSADVPPPPKLSNSPTPADADDAPSVTIRQDGDTKIEEFRTQGGRVYAVRVTPRIGKPYLLVDPDGHGVVPNTTELSGGVRPTQWTIFEF